MSQLLEQLRQQVAIILSGGPGAYPIYPYVLTQEDKVAEDWRIL